MCNGNQNAPTAAADGEQHQHKGGYSWRRPPACHLGLALLEAWRLLFIEDKDSRAKSTNDQQKIEMECCHIHYNDIGETDATFAVSEDDSDTVIVPPASPDLMFSRSQDDVARRRSNDAEFKRWQLSSVATSWKAPCLKAAVSHFGDDEANDLHEWLIGMPVERRKQVVAQLEEILKELGPADRINKLHLEQQGNAIRAFFRSSSTMIQV